MVTWRSNEHTLEASRAVDAAASSPPHRVTAGDEWRQAWQLPLTCMLGIAGVHAFTYSHGVFLEEVTNEFGWTRGQFSSAYSLNVLLAIMIGPFAGRLIDRYGSRRILGIAIVPHLLVIALFGFASDSLTDWRLLSLAQGVAAAFVGPTVWIAAVVGRFDRARGMAVATALAGHGLGAMIWPVAAAGLIREFGWRMAFPAMAASYGVLVLPLIYLYFHGALAAEARTTPEKPRRGNPVWPALRSRTFILVTLAGGLFISVSIGMTFHMVPLMRSMGFGMATAAMLASMAGFASFVGRFGTGFLLDRVSSRILGVAVFLLPVVVVGILLVSPVLTLPSAILAVALFGLAAGAETDVITYIIARKMAASFASIYSVTMTVFGLFASVGPVLAGHLYDLNKSYDAYLLSIVPVVAVGAVLIALVPDVNADRDTAGSANTLAPRNN